MGNEEMVISYLNYLVKTYEDVTKARDALRAARKEIEQLRAQITTQEYSDDVASQKTRETH